MTRVEPSGAVPDHVARVRALTDARGQVAWVPAGRAHADGVPESLASATRWAREHADLLLDG